jgi:hypothetical protein
MNDDFLHRIRAEPPAEFLARLKSRLDLQPPPTTPVPRGSALNRVLLGLLLTGSVFAITLLVLNREEPQAPPVVATQSEPDTTQRAPAVAKSTQPLDTPAHKPPETKPITDKRSTTLASPSFSYVTTTSLQLFLTTHMPPGRNATIIAADSAEDAAAEYCHTSQNAKSNSATPLMVLLTRRMTRAELDSCNRRFGSIAEKTIGDQAVVLARSKLYGAFSLTPTELFLALAAQIPDPSQPGKLIPNPNTMWSEVNSSLEREPIEFFGPQLSSPVGIAFREMLFEVGCRALPAMANVEKCPDLRTDGVYVEAAPIPSDMLLKLQTKPNAIGILAYGGTFLGATELTASPIQGVMPTRETIANQTYPGARPLYLYYELRFFQPFIQSSYTFEHFAIIPPERSQP